VDVIKYVFLQANQFNGLSQNRRREREGRESL